MPDAVLLPLGDDVQQHAFGAAGAHGRRDVQILILLPAFGRVRSPRSAGAAPPPRSGELVAANPAPEAARRRGFAKPLGRRGAVADRSRLLLTRSENLRVPRRISSGRERISSRAGTPSISTIHWWIMW